jgi:hypothetical protein
MQHHNYSLSDIEEWLPFERDIYVQMLIEYLKKEKERIENENSKMKSQAARRR